MLESSLLGLLIGVAVEKVAFAETMPDAAHGTITVTLEPVQSENITEGLMYSITEGGASKIMTQDIAADAFDTAKGLTSLLQSQLQNIHGVSYVEREDIDLVLDEMERALVLENDNIGKWLKADLLICARIDYYRDDAKELRQALLLRAVIDSAFVAGSGFCDGCP